MSLIDRIPMPKPGGQAFNEAFNKFAETRRKNQLLPYQMKQLNEHAESYKLMDAFRKSQLEETSKYHKGLLGVQQQNANRAAQLAPLQYELLKQKIEEIRNGRGRKESPEERQEREIETAEKKEENKLKVKTNNEYLNVGDIVNNASSPLETIFTILEKHPGNTGNMAGIRNFLHIGNETQGKLNAAMVPLQAALGKEISQRGGAVAASLAAPGKPGIWQNQNYNMGSTKQLIEKSIKAFNMAKQNYEESTGKPYPKKLPKFLKSYEDKYLNKVTMYLNGEEYHIPKDEAPDAEKEGYTYEK